MELNKGRVHSNRSIPCSVIAANPTPTEHVQGNDQLPTANCQLGRRRRQDKTRQDACTRIQQQILRPGGVKLAWEGDIQEPLRRYLAKAEEVRNSDLEYTPPPPPPPPSSSRRVCSLGFWAEGLPVGCATFVQVPRFRSRVAGNGMLHIRPKAYAILATGLTCPQPPTSTEIATAFKLQPSQSGIISVRRKSCHRSPFLASSVFLPCFSSQHAAHSLGVARQTKWPSGGRLTKSCAAASFSSISKLASLLVSVVNCRLEKLSTWHAEAGQQGDPSRESGIGIAPPILSHRQLSAAKSLLCLLCNDISLLLSGPWVI